MSDSTEGERPRGRDQRGHCKASEPDAVFEIYVVDGAEGERLARQQAKVLYEIMEWYAQQQQPDTTDDT